MNPYKFRWKALGIPLLFHTLLIGFLLFKSKPVPVKIKQPSRVQTIQLRPKQAVNSPSITPLVPIELINTTPPIEIDIVREPIAAEFVKRETVLKKPTKKEPAQLEIIKSEIVKSEIIKSEIIKEPLARESKATEKKKTKVVKKLPMNKRSPKEGVSLSKTVKTPPPYKKTSESTTTSSVLAAASAALDILHSLKDPVEKTIKMAFRVENIEALKSESFKSYDRVAASEKNYQEDISAALQYSLVLPEQGEIVLLLTLHSDGKVKTVKIKRAESIKNSHYVSEKVPYLRFPDFKELFKGEKDHTFVITLCNK